MLFWISGFVICEAIFLLKVHLYCDVVQLGQKGIGFKSVFRVTDVPEIHSNGFHIRFDVNSGPLGYIMPHWVDTDEPDSDEYVAEFVVAAAEVWTLWTHYSALDSVKISWMSLWEQVGKMFDIAVARRCQVVFTRLHQCALQSSTPHLASTLYRFCPLLSRFEYVDCWTYPGISWAIKIASSVHWIWTPI